MVICFCQHLTFFKNVHFLHWERDNCRSPFRGKKKTIGVLFFEHLIQVLFKCIISSIQHSLFFFLYFREDCYMGFFVSDKKSFQRSCNWMLCPLRNISCKRRFQKLYARVPKLKKKKKKLWSSQKSFGGKKEETDSQKLSILNL